ncbi:MAG TPA: hypothetical protein VI160_05005, partial [Gemmatimonadales bacterium]
MSLARRLFALTLVPAALGAQQPPAAPPARVFIKAGRLIDGRAAAAAANVGILIEGDRITAVGP